MGTGTPTMAKKQVASVKIDPELHADVRAIAALYDMDVGEYYADRIQVAVKKDAADLGLDLRELRRKVAKKKPKPPPDPKADD